MNMNDAARSETSRVYIAAPLFNPPQIEVIEGIEIALAGDGWQYFSPRKLHLPGTGTKIRDEAHAQKVYDANVAGLMWCTHLLCVLDYKLPPSDALILHQNREHTDERYTRTVKEFKTPLHLPDTGVVWEMGFVAGLNELVDTLALPWNMKKIIGYTEYPERAQNLMLLKSLDALLPGRAALRQWIRGGDEILNAYPPKARAI